MANASQHPSSSAAVSTTLSEQELIAQNDEKLQLALTKFERIMELRAGMGLRLACRVRTVIRWGMVGLVLITIGLLVLMALLTIQIQEASQSSRVMANEVSRLSADMHIIRASVDQMRQAMTRMPTLADSVGAIGGTTSQMSEKVQNMQDKVAEVEQRVDVLRGRVKNMGSSVRHMRGDVGGMSRNVGHIAKPIP